MTVLNAAGWIYVALMLFDLISCDWNVTRQHYGAASAFAIAFFYILGLSVSNEIEKVIWRRDNE